MHLQSRNFLKSKSSWIFFESRTVLVITGAEWSGNKSLNEHGITDPDFTLSDEILDFPADADVILVSLFFHSRNLLGASGTVDISQIFFVARESAKRLAERPRFTS